MHSRTIAKIEAGHIADPRPSSIRLFAPFALTGPEREAFFGAARGDAPTVARLGLNQLPADVAGFVGRHHELDELDAILDRHRSDDPEPSTTVVVSGTAGVGNSPRRALGPSGAGPVTR